MSDNHLEKKKKLFALFFWIGLIVAVYLGKSLWSKATLGKAEVLTPTDFVKPLSRIVVYIKVDASGYPTLYYEQLRLSKGLGALSLSEPIASPQALVGKVSITSPQAALQYVRLFTSPATAYLWGPDEWREIIPADDVTAAYLFGRSKKTFSLSEADIKAIDERMRASLKITDYQAGSNGYVTREEWQTNRLRAPEVVKTDQGYLVKRELFHVTGDDPISNTICWGAETVTPQGKITRKILSRTESNIDFMIQSSRELY